MYKNHYFSTVFTKEFVIVLTCLYVALFLTNFYYIKKYGLKKSKVQAVNAIILLIGANMISIFSIENLQTYYYMLVALIVIYVCELGKIFFTIGKVINKNN